MCESHEPSLSTTSDYEYTYSDCVQNSDSTLTRNKTYNWIVPRTCNVGAVQLPPTEQVSCRACAAGYETSNGVCQPCAAGSASAGGDACVVCPAGSVALPVLDFDEWDSWDELNGDNHNW